MLKYVILLAISVAFIVGARFFVDAFVHAPEQAEVSQNQIAEDASSQLWTVEVAVGRVAENGSALEGTVAKSTKYQEEGDSITVGLDGVSASCVESIRALPEGSHVLVSYREALPEGLFVEADAIEVL